MYHLRSTVARYKPTSLRRYSFICFNLFLNFDAGKRSTMISQTNPFLETGGLCGGFFFVCFTGGTPTEK